MSWIKIRTNLATDPAVAAVAAITRQHPRQVVGCLVVVWCWADPLTASGWVPHATPALIDSIAGKRGFAAALETVGWLVIEQGGVTFPKWDRHNSQSAKARAGELERKRLQRHPDSAARRLSGQTSGPLSGQSAGLFPDPCPDKRRGEESSEIESPAGADDARKLPGLQAPPEPPQPAAEALSPRPAPPPPEPPPKRHRDPLFEALARAEGSDPAQLTRSRARTIGVALAEIRSAAPEVTPDEIARRAERYARVMPAGTRVTAPALAAHWARCVPLPPAAPPPEVPGPDGWRDYIVETYPDRRENYETGPWSAVPDWLRREIMQRPEFATEGAA